MTHNTTGAEMALSNGGYVWLCPQCFQPSEAGPSIPDEEDRPCEHGVSLAPFRRLPDTRPSDTDD